MFSTVIWALSCQVSVGIASNSDSAQIANDIVRLVNQDDVSGMETLALPEFFEKIPASMFPSLVHQLHSMGTLSAPRLVTDLGERRKYRVTISHDTNPAREILMVLGAESSRKFFSLGFESYKPPVPAAQELKSNGPTQGKWANAIAASVNEYALYHHVDGISVGVVSEGGTFRSNFGESRPAVKANSSTVYEIGSLTKTMTGYLVARAVLDNKVDLDQDIRNLLPGDYDNLRYGQSPITFRHLATHTSGLPANPAGIPDDAGGDAYAGYSHEKLLADLKSIKLTYEPGTLFAYSNMGGGLAGLLLENVYHQAYTKQLQTKLFRPLGMSNTAFGVSRRMEKQYALPHDAKGERSDRWTVNGIEAAGGVKSTLDDLIKYAKFNLAASDKAVTLQLSEQTRGTTPRFGLFWLLGKSRLGGNYFNHEGGTGGFTSHILILPESKLAVIVLMNTGGQDAGSIAYNVALRCLWNQAGK